MTDPANRERPGVEHHVLRLRPGADLKRALLDYARERDLRAAWVVTAVGSLTDLHLRYADRDAGTRDSGHFEIVALSGTLAADAAHLHLGVADGRGRMTGGHLLDGNLVYTTAEIVVAEHRGLAFARELDPASGYRELVVRERAAPAGE